MGYYDTQKKERYERIVEKVKPEGEEKDTLISKIKVDMGLRQEKAEEYISDLFDAGRLEKEDGKVVAVDSERVEVE